MFVEIFWSVIYSLLFIHYFTPIYKLKRVQLLILYADLSLSVGMRLMKGRFMGGHEIIKHKTYTEITYTQKDGVKKKLYVPSGRRVSMCRHRYKYYLVDKNDNKSIIDVSEDFPILVSAADLGGVAIEIQDLHGNIVATFGTEEIPSF